MGIIRLDFHYRRRHLDGTTAINTLSGPVLVRRDDATALVVDFLWPGPQFTSPIVGRRGSATTTIPRFPMHCSRQWLWPGRWMRLLQQFDADGRCTVYRVDFATPLWRKGAACFQTDLYLDLFASPGGDYAIVDEDELEIARDQGLIDSQAQALILAQLDELTALLEANRFTAWLDSICPTPFDPVVLPPMPGWQHREFSPGEPDGWPQIDGDA